VKTLTKADILRTSKQSEEVQIEGLKGTILLRPVTDGEYQYAKNIVLKAVSAGADLDTLVKSMQDQKEQTGAVTLEGMKINLDMGSLTEAEFESKIYLVSRSLSVNEKWSPEDVKKISPVGVVDKIAAKVYEISNISESMEDLISYFR